MLYVPQVNHGFGWFVDRYHGRRIGQHSGGTPGVSSAIYRFIDDGLSVTLLTNDADRILDQFAIELPACTSPRYARAESGPRRMRHIVQRLFTGGRDDAALINPMRLFLDTATGKGHWQWFGSHGELTGLTFSSEEPTPAALVLAVPFQATRLYRSTIS